MKEYFIQLWCIIRFAAAMFGKLRYSERKYHWGGAWHSSAYSATENNRCLRYHVDKGDPRDVGIYAAFAYWHEWRTK